MQDGHAEAGFWLRAAATTVDTVLLMILIYPVVWLIYGEDYFIDPTYGISGPADFLLTWVVPVLFTITFWIFRQATPGKMVMSLKVVDASSGQPPDTLACFLRYAGYLLSALPLGLGFIWIAFDKQKQGWHDKLANTRVVRLGVSATSESRPSNEYDRQAKEAKPRQEPAPIEPTAPHIDDAETPRHEAFIETPNGSIAIHTGEFSLGALSDNDLVVDDDTVSRRHARIDNDQSDYTLIDLNSTNGTRVNGQAVQRHRLQTGDKIQLGDWQACFEIREIKG